MDSVHEELQSLRRTSTAQEFKAGLGRGFLDFARKSFSTNSSPIKQKLDSADNHQVDIESGENESDDEFDRKSLRFDPFLEVTDGEIPIANSTVLSTAQSGAKRSKNKSVRFHEWEKTLDDNQQQILRNKLRQFKKSRAPSVKSLHFNSIPVSKDRASSSEYSATPDTTEISDTHNDHSGTLTATQKLYLLPEENHLDKKSHLKRSEQYIPLTDLTKTPKLVKSSTDPIVSASTDQSSVFSKAETVTEPSAKLENEDPPEKKIKNKSKSWHKLHNTQSVKGHKSRNVFLDEDTTSHSLSEKFKAMNIKDGNTIKGTKAAPSGSPFSLRLHKIPKLEERNHRSEGSNEESYDHVDILEQSPPRLPEVSNANETSVFEKDTSLQELTEPLFESISEVQLGTAQTCSIHLSLEVQQMIKQSIETLARASNNPIVIDENEEIKDESAFFEKIEQIQSLSQSCDKKMDTFKIQLIKLSKQMVDHENTLQEKESSRKILQKKLKDAMDDLESLRIECSRFESRITSQSNTITFERQTAEKLEKDLSLQKRFLIDVQNNLEDKELFVESITRLVKSNFDHELDVLDEKKVLEALRDIMIDYSNLKEANKDHFKVETSLQKHSSALQEELDSFKNEYQKVKELLETSNEKNIANEKEFKKKDKALEDLTLENENCRNLLKSLEYSYSDLRNQLENEKFRTKELEAKIQELEAERETNKRKTTEMEKVLHDQLALVDEVHTEIEQQASTITKLQENNEKLKEEKSQAKQLNEDYKNEMAVIRAEINDARNHYKKLQLSNEDTEKRKNRVLRSKDEEISGYRKRVGDLELVESNLGSELKETRAKLSDKFSQCSLLDKKVGNLTQSLKDCNENNRLLRSEMLKSNVLRQELKRTLIGLSISIVRDLDGIIDNESLSTVREDLKDETDDKNLEKLHDIALFIEEAVGLIIKEYWSLSKRLSDSQKGSLSNSSLNALQLIIEGQNERLKKLQGKLQYYESIFKKINKANGKSLIRTRPSTSTVKDDTRRVRVQLSTDSDDSYGTVRTVHTNPLREKKADEINRLLSKVKASGSSISESSE